jgi:hypothetical protein
MTTVAFAASSATRASGNEKPRSGGRGLSLLRRPTSAFFFFFILQDHDGGSNERAAANATAIAIVTV